MAFSAPADDPILISSASACSLAFFAFVDILANPDIRSNLPKYANWPTFPQLWVKGELVGGCDIVTEMFENGELLPMITAAVPDEAPKADA